MYNYPTNGANDNRGGMGQLVQATQSLPAMPDLYSPLGGGYGPSVPSGSELLGLKLFEIWRILNKRKWLILSIVAACVVLNAVRTLMQTPIYTATVRLQIDPMSNIVSNENAQSNESDYQSNFMLTQQQILASRHMAERVASA